MRSFLIGAAVLLPLAASAVYYPSGYTMPAPATTPSSHFMTTSPNALVSPFRIYQLSQYSYTQAPQPARTSRLCDARFNTNTRRMPSWCARLSPAPVAMPSVTMTQTNPLAAGVPQRSASLVSTGFAYDQAAPATLTADAVPALRFHISQPSAGVRQFQAASVVEGARFRLSSANAGTVNWNDFELVINGQATPFDTSGYVSADLGFRLTGGDTQQIEVGVRLRPQGALPLYRGSFELELLEFVASRENSASPITVKMTGDSRSRRMAFSPFTAVQTSGFVQVIAQSDDTSALTAGGIFDLMDISFEPQFADVEIDTLRIYNTTTTDASDVFERVYLYNASTEELLDSATFSGNTAEFRPLRGISDLLINQETKVVVRGLLRDEIPVGAQLRFDLGTSDIELRSLVSGNDISADRINLNTAPATTRTASEGALIIRHGASQPTYFAASGLHETVYRFEVQNPSEDTLYMARMVLNVRANGMTWNDTINGPNAGDFRIVRKQDGRSVSQSSWIATDVDANGDVTFDTSTPVLIRPGDVRSYELQVSPIALGNNQDDSISVLWQDDATPLSGTLPTVKSLGGRIIWTTDAFLRSWNATPAADLPSTAIIINRD